MIGRKGGVGIDRRKVSGVGMGGRYLGQRRGRNNFCTPLFVEALVLEIKINIEE